MKFASTLLIVLFSQLTYADWTPPSPVFREVEQQVLAKSWAGALKTMEAIDRSTLTAQESSWLDFRIQDMTWRNQRASKHADDSLAQVAIQELETMIRDVQRPEEKGRLYVEVLESLADAGTHRNGNYSPHREWHRYQQALDVWAGSTDLETARKRFIGIIRKAAFPDHPAPYYYYGYYGTFIPESRIDQGLRIAQTDQDRSLLNYLKLRALEHRQTAAASHEFIERLSEALRQGRETPWEDDLLWLAGQYWENKGGFVSDQKGAWHWEPDYQKALHYYRTLASRFPKGTSRWADDAQNRIHAITNTTLSVQTSYVFSPETKPAFFVNSRNLKKVQVALYAINLTRDVHFSPKDSLWDWRDRTDIKNQKPVHRYTIEPSDKQKHAPYREEQKLKEALAPGAYLIVVSGKGQEARELLLVSDTVMLAKQLDRGKHLFWVTDAVSGTPLSGQSVRLYWSTRKSRENSWHQLDGTTDDDGLVTLEIPTRDHVRNMFVCTSDRSGRAQAFVTQHNRNRSQRTEGYKFYISTDRPAYRPGHELKWKVTARQEVNEHYQTPSGETMGVVLRDAKGNELWADTVTLNSFGSAWGELALTDKMALGLITVEFRKDGPKGKRLGHAQVCRLEEYKLPEFKVSISTARDDAGRPKTFRTGDRIQAEISADYYYGEPVSGAEVSVIIRQKSLYLGWHDQRAFPWFYSEEQNNQPYRWQQPQEIKRETIRTDKNGKAVISIDTRNFGNAALAFSVEARVVDASRREVTGHGSVKVTPTSHRARVKTDHALHAPGDEINLTVSTLDANDLPYPTSGTLTVFKRIWTPVWKSPEGKLFSGDTLRRFQSHCVIWPPKPPAGLPPWRVIQHSYEEQEVFSTNLEVGESGSLDTRFTPTQQGYYHAYWKSEGANDDVVEARTDLWVTTPDSNFTGFHSGPLKIIVDKDTFREGEKAMVMIHSDLPGRHVLFSHETDRVLRHEVLHLNGEAKVLILDVDESFVPNLFLEANTVVHRHWHRDQVEIVTPPHQHFLDVQVTYDQESYQPGQTGIVEITTLDSNGNAIAAELSLSALDQSVLAIQKDLSGDPRKFFFGNKRYHNVQTRVGFYDKSYLHQPIEAEEENQHGHKSPPTEAPMSFGQSHNLSAASDPFAASDGFAGAGGGLRLQAAKQEAGLAGATANRGLLSLSGQLDHDRPEQAHGADNVVVRHDFRDTMVWHPDLQTDASGKATASVVFPDTLTTWNATVRAVTEGAKFGIGATNVVSNLPLVLRMQHPRFLVTGDRATLSANLHNRTETGQEFTVSLLADGLELESADTIKLRIAPDEQKRVDWIVYANQPGDVTLTMKAVGASASDAMQRSITVIEHGMMRQLTETARTTGTLASVAVELPAERKNETTELVVQVAPSLAVTMLDALPYLIQYPYGCVEQTMNRFMPSIVVRNTLRAQGLSVADIESRMFGGVQQAHIGTTHHPHTDPGKLNDVMDKGMKRLADFQHPDGGWGWWKEGDSDDYMSAYVVWGLLLARQAGETVNHNVIQNGIRYLEDRLIEQENNPDLQAWMLHALSYATGGVGKKEMAAQDNCFKKRSKLTAYARALLTLAYHNRENAKALILATNLENGVRVDEAPDRSVLVHGNSTRGSSAPMVAWWGKDSGFRHWYEGGIETTAFSIMALLATDPDHPLIDQAALWLVKNRRGANWNNTKDTAIAVLALNQYLKARQELTANFDYTVRVNGKEVGQASVRPETALRAPGRFTVPTKWIRDGLNLIEVERDRSGSAVTLSATATFFSLENPIPASGHELYVKRQYFREVKVPTLLNGHTTDLIELHDGDALQSGDRVEVVLTAEAKNDLEYLMFEDRKPAGLEAVGVKSGAPANLRQLTGVAARTRFAGASDSSLPSDYTGNRRSAHQELRDRHIAIFADKLPQGYWEIRYTLRAETPGRFHALPVDAGAMYIPEIRGNSEEIRLTVE